jgi:hypothetical protein
MTFTTPEPAPLAAGLGSTTTPALENHTMSNTTTIKFRKLRDTKNTARFEEEVPAGKPPVIGTIYIQKWFAGDAGKLTITINKEGK